jgi:molybdopterin-guanine dinucleotide biosynthesis protein B
VAIASDAPVPQAKVPVLDLDDIEIIADALLAEALPVERLVEPPMRV